MLASSLFEELSLSVQVLTTWTCMGILLWNTQSESKPKSWKKNVVSKQGKLF
jgi:hypothetical protein